MLPSDAEIRRLVDESQARSNLRRTHHASHARQLASLVAIMVIAAVVVIVIITLSQ